MKNTSQSKKNSGREYISYNTNRVIIFGTDGSKFKLRSVFDILTGKINMFVNKISILSLCMHPMMHKYLVDDVDIPIIMYKLDIVTNPYFSQISFALSFSPALSYVIIML